MEGRCAIWWWGQGVGEREGAVEDRRQRKGGGGGRGGKEVGGLGRFMVSSISSLGQSHFCSAFVLSTCYLFVPSG